MKITYHTENFVDEWGDMLACPICKDHYVHFEKPKYIFSRDEWRGAWDGRGNAIKIKLNCENGHEWVLRLGHHKGQTYLNVEDVKNQDIIG